MSALALLGYPERPCGNTNFKGMPGAGSGGILPAQTHFDEARMIMGDFGETACQNNVAYQSCVVCLHGALQTGSLATQTTMRSLMHNMCWVIRGAQQDSGDCQRLLCGARELKAGAVRAGTRSPNTMWMVVRLEASRATSTTAVTRTCMCR